HSGHHAGHRLRAEPVEHLLEALPVGCHPYFGMRPPMGPYQRRDFCRGLVVRRLEDIETVVRSQDGVAVQPLHVRTMRPHLLHGLLLQFFERLRRAHDFRRHPGNHMEQGILINIPQRTQFYFEGGAPALQFPVGLGRPDWPTPVGPFTVAALQADKEWNVPKSIREEMARERSVVMSCMPPAPRTRSGGTGSGSAFRESGSTAASRLPACSTSRATAASGCTPTISPRSFRACPSARRDGSSTNPYCSRACKAAACCWRFTEMSTNESRTRSPLWSALRRSAAWLRSSTGEKSRKCCCARPGSRSKLAGAECLRAADPARRAARYAAALLAGTAIWLAAAQDGGAENLLVLRAGIDE